MKKELEQLLETFQKIQELATQVKYPELDETEAWKGEIQEPTIEGSILQNSIVCNGYLNVLCRQVFWIQSRMIEAGLGEEGSPAQQ